MAGSFNRNDHYTPSSPYHDQHEMSPVDARNPLFQGNGSPPPPPVHRTPVGMHPDSAYHNMQGQRNPNNYSDYTPPGMTPAAADSRENISSPGSINGFAPGAAGDNGALRDLNGWGRNGNNLAGPQDRNSTGTPFADHYGYDSPAHPRPIHSQASYGSNAPLAASAMPHGGRVSPAISGSERSLPLSNRPSPPQSSYPPYQDTPYNRYSSSTLQLAPQMGAINPQEADDDDDWGMGPRAAQQKRRSFVPFGGSRDQSREGTPGSSAAALGTAAGAGAGAAAGAGAYSAARDSSGQYNAVPGGAPGQANASEIPGEKSEWLTSQSRGSKKLKWIVTAIIVLVIIGAIVGGVLGATLGKGGGGGGGGDGDNRGETAGSVADDNKDDLTADSAEIKKLMNNKNLHKVFPGMDYTPLNSQYPDCMHVPPSQNNITRDIAVLSQLTNSVRLYGTDCNQTEMVLEAIDRLKLKDMRVWMGVWLGDNSTTNDRQIRQMWDLIDHHQEIDGSKQDIQKRFKGIILGNEVLFRKDLTETDLMDYIKNVKQNLTDHEIDLPIAMADLGDKWNEDMAQQVDVVMSNVHPFFAGVTAEDGAGWTWEFWQGHNVILTADKPEIQQIIAEVGWPSAGGNSCGNRDCDNDSEGSVAGIEEMNTFMEKWICPSMENGTDYFWFSAFDEPWKIRYNEAGKNWEDKWGLMDVDRNLKKGLEIPDCGGKTVS